MARTVRTSIPIILGAMTIIIVVGAVVVYTTERSHNPEFRTLGDCFWFIIVTMSTVGYGDKVPVTAGGRAMASVAMVAGPVLLASSAASVGATFYDEWQKGVKGMSKISSKGHILICGWNVTAANVIAELRQSELFTKTPITVIDAEIDANPSKDSKTSFVHGVPSDVRTLEQANVGEAGYAIVVAKDNTPTADQQTVLTVLAIKHINPRLYICAEVNDVNNGGHLKRAGCDTVVNTRSLTGGILALSLENPATSDVIGELASFQGNEVYRLNLPREAEQHKFGELLNDFKKDYDAILIGIEREGKTILNPSADLELKSTDYLLALAEEYPHLIAQ
jgi:voltage-gated potassium channel